MIYNLKSSDNQVRYWRKSGEFLYITKEEKEEDEGTVLQTQGEKNG